MVGICAERNHCPNLESFGRVNHVHYPLMIANARTIQGDGPFGEVQGLPVTYLMSTNGELIKRFRGRIPVAYAMDILNQHINKSSKQSTSRDQEEIQ